MAGVDDNPESVLERLRPKLTEAFKFNLKDLANLMQSKGFLSDEDRDIVTALGSTPTKSTKAGIMVDSLISKVKINPQHYETFLKLLQPQQNKFEDVVYLLTSSESGLVLHFST